MSETPGNAGVDLLDRVRRPELPRRPARRATATASASRCSKRLSWRHGLGPGARGQVRDPASVEGKLARPPRRDPGMPPHPHRHPRAPGRSRSDTSARRPARPGGLVRHPRLSAGHASRGPPWRGPGDAFRRSAGGRGGRGASRRSYPGTSMSLAPRISRRRGRLKQAARSP